MRDRRDAPGGDRSIRNAKRHERSVEGRGVRRGPDADAGVGPSAGPADGPAGDDRTERAMADVSWHLDMVEQQDPENQDHRIREARSISRDLSTGTPSKATARNRTQQVDDLLQRADTTGDPDADSHVDTARQMVRDLLWWIKP
ncbi:hypothetical protein BV210_06885 [Halorientalis sp. IM1011]|uniref:hypothetical protein n=1 Tax=Halorientalis sp. IM1011 TaxID=1932360 RepID=UPI00097CC0C3|nr:hypothetical protein [Halorientalis sp. IM1011]AQL42454.1 hypothetical protein BV210_06885 [Halorientalis sp. IM1011]